jgi:hypothetical protein
MPLISIITKISRVPFRSDGAGYERDVQTKSGLISDQSLGPNARLRGRQVGPMVQLESPWKSLRRSLMATHFGRSLSSWPGVVEDDVRRPAEKGTPQGAVISPLLANIYLH